MSVGETRGGGDNAVPNLRVPERAARGLGATGRGCFAGGAGGAGSSYANSGSPARETPGDGGMTSAVSATFQPISPASWHPNPGPPKPEATRANEERTGEEGQAASLWRRRGPAARIQGAPGSGSGVWRGAGGGGRARRAAGVGGVGIRRRWSGPGELRMASCAGPTASASFSSSSCCRRRPSARTGWTRRRRPLRRCRAGPAPSG